MKKKISVDKFGSLIFVVTHAECDEHNLTIDVDLKELEGGGYRTVAYCESQCSGTLGIGTECGISVDVMWSAIGGRESYSDAFDMTICPLGHCLTEDLRGAVIVDQNGEPLGDTEASHVIEAKLVELDWLTHIEKVLPAPSTTFVDGNGDEIDHPATPKKGFSVFRRARLAEPPLQFCGKLLATVESSTDPYAYEFSGNRNSWEVMELFKLESNAYVWVKHIWSKWSNIKDHVTTDVVESEAELFNLYPDDWLANSLLKTAKIKRKANTQVVPC